MRILQRVEERAELGQQLLGVLGRLVAVLYKRARLQATFDLPDPLLQIGPVTECFSNDHVPSATDKKLRC